MSILVGSPTSRWPLGRAIDALAEAARGAALPGPVWLAGILYPSLNLSWDLLRSLLGVIEHATGISMAWSVQACNLFGIYLPPFIGQGMDLPTTFCVTAITIPLLPAYSRLVVGLAKVSDPQYTPPDGAPGRGATLGGAWRAGQGLGFVALGMWILLVALLLAALVVLIGPLVLIVQVLGLENISPVFVGLLLPVLLILLLYSAVLQVVNQLALHSLAHNRRGVVSAMNHAWRLVRTSPWSTTRAAMVDFLLFLTVFVAVTVLATVGKVALVIGLGSSLLFFALYGFAGVARAAFWARTYRGLGGLSAEDQVPGL